MALSEPKRKRLTEMLCDGFTQKEVADELKISEKTVSRVKKALVESNSELAHVLTENKYNRFVRKSEEKFNKKIGLEKKLFEDKEEGWTFHMTAEEFKAQKSSKWWSGIVYPESADENWLERLTQLQCEISVSPLHDKDFWNHDSPAVMDDDGVIIEDKGSRYKAGDRKKAHWHFIIKFDKMMTFEEVNRLIREITNGPYLQKCYSLKGMYEYFIHLNNPEKYQYDKSEIQSFNGFIIETTNADRIVMVDEVGRVIDENGFDNMMELRRYYDGQYEYINVISLKSFYFEKLLQTNYRIHFPEGRTQNVRLVNLKGENNYDSNIQSRITKHGSTKSRRSRP